MGLADLGKVQRAVFDESRVSSEQVRQFECYL